MTGRTLIGRLRWTAVLSVLALLVTAGIRPSAAAAYSVSEVYATTTPNATSVPVAVTAGDSVPVVASQRQITVAPGDIVLVLATTQVTSSYPPAIMVGRYLQLGSRTVSRKFATNITGQLHHLPMATMASVKVRTAGTLYVRQLVYAASDAARPGWALHLDYVELHVTVLRL